MKNTENMKNMKQIAEDIAKKIEETTSEKPTEHYFNKADNMRKEIERFLKNVYSALDIPFSAYTYRSEYKLNQWLSEYLTQKLLTYTLPRKRDIEDALRVPTELSTEIFQVIKNFNEENFSKDTCEKIAKKVRQRKTNVLEAFKILYENVEVAIKNFEDYKFCLLGRDMTMGDIEAFISEVYKYCDEDCTDTDAIFSKRDITLLDLLKLAQTLKHLEEKLSDEMIIKNLREFNK